MRLQGSWRSGGEYFVVVVPQHLWFLIRIIKVKTARVEATVSHSEFYIALPKSIQDAQSWRFVFKDRAVLVAPPPESFATSAMRALAGSNPLIVQPHGILGPGVFGGIGSNRYGDGPPIIRISRPEVSGSPIPIRDQL